ncbi:MAG: hypothetical protein KKC18_14775 [Chloroflexi bacterium]|nr:hypothetical protein [Chloroflexota bacterium]
MVSEAKARTQRIALASFAVAASTLISLMMMVVPGLASEMIPEQIQALFLAGDSALVIAGAGLSLS